MVSSAGLRWFKMEQRHISNSKLLWSRCTITLQLIASAAARAIKLLQFDWVWGATSWGSVVHCGSLKQFEDNFLSVSRSLGESWILMKHPTGAPVGREIVIHLRTGNCRCEVQASSSFLLLVAFSGLGQHTIALFGVIVHLLQSNLLLLIRLCSILNQRKPAKETVC